MRLSKLTGDAKFHAKARRELQPFLTGAKPAIAEPYQLTSLAGHLALADLATFDGSAAADQLARKAADFLLPQPEAGGGADRSAVVRFGRQWTDDMFMASSLLSRVATRTDDAKYADAVGRLLISYAGKLQRPDGLFIHAIEGPFAWGRGNGFAALGLADALQHLKPTWADRARVLDIYQRQMRGLLAHQSDDGAWRQVVDEPSSYRELTVTAMTISAMARGVRHGWLEPTFRPAIDRGWRALLARVQADGNVIDVCASTGAGPTKEYYLTRPALSGADDRGGAMALLAALEMAELTR
jgi:unsaturated rhamnogalacturonyl hydrolase